MTAEWHASQQLDGRAALPAAEAQLGRLGETTQVGHAQHHGTRTGRLGLALLVGLVHLGPGGSRGRDGETGLHGSGNRGAGTPDVGDHGGIVSGEYLQLTGGELRVLMPHEQHAPQPVQERRRVALLGLDVDSLVAVHRVHERRQVQLREVGPGEAGVPVRSPLHRRAHAVPVPEVDVVAHENLVAVVEHGAARQRQEQPVEEFGHSPVVVDEGGEAPADPEVPPHPGVVGVLVVHVVALFVGDHLEGELVVVAQEDPPLASVGDGRGLSQDLGDRETLLAADGHEHAGHEGEVEGNLPSEIKYEKL